MPSHIRMVLTRTTETIPIAYGTMQLETWQGVFLFEHRRAASANDRSGADQYVFSAKINYALTTPTNFLKQFVVAKVTEYFC